MNGKSFKRKKKKKRNRVEAGEKIKLQKKTEIRAEKGQTKKLNLGWYRDRKENPISAPSIHVGVLVGAGSLWPKCWVLISFLITIGSWYLKKTRIKEPLVLVFQNPQRTVEFHERTSKEQMISGRSFEFYKKREPWLYIRQGI